MSNTPTPTTDAPDDTEIEEPPAPKPTETVDYWKQKSRENEKRAKANADAATELDKLRAASMSELERAVAEAKSSVRAEVLREVGASRVDDFVRVAAAGRAVDVDALLDGLDRNRFLDDDGLPDPKAIGLWMDRVAPPDEGKQARVPTGARGGPTPKETPGDAFARIRAAQLG